MDRPIGYWLKHLDNLLERQLKTVLSAQRLTRREWQVLNTLSRSTADLSALTAALAPFWDAGDDVDAVAQALITRGLVAAGPGGMALTDAGRATHAEAAAAVGHARAVVTEGMTVEQYQTTVANLATMARNVETYLDASPGSPQGTVDHV
jgi:hypothetical protein